MRITKRQLRRIIKEEIVRINLVERVSSHAVFDADYVTFPDGRDHMGLADLAREVAPRDAWYDDFGKVNMFAAMALKQNHGITTVTDPEVPGRTWTIDEFIADWEVQ